MREKKREEQIKKQSNQLRNSVWPVDLKEVIKKPSLGNPMDQGQWETHTADKDSA